LDQRQIGEAASVNPHLPRHAQLTPLTGIRGAAAVWVVAFHAYPLVGSLFGWPERWRVLVVRDGFLAVDLFFVLSGFVLSVAYNERLRSNFRSSLAEFAVARVCRIFPLHWTTLGILVLLSMAFSHEWWGPGPFTFLALVKSAVLVQDWTSSTALAWNHPTWSLSAEWAAYLLFPFITCSMNWLRSRSLALLGSMLSLLALDVLLLSTGSASLDHVGPAGIVRCLCEFSAGALAWKALSAESWSSRVLGETCFVLGTGSLALAVIDSECQILASYAFVALVVGCALPCRSANWLFGNRVSIFLGDVSFSIYLVHIIVLGCVAAAVDRFHLNGASLFARLSVSLAFPLLVLAVAYLAWRLIEKPSQQFARELIYRARAEKPKNP
jgi:peptidoglycan/LPS O-acetylase OafA/YrhL